LINFEAFFFIFYSHRLTIKKAQIHTTNVNDDR